MSTEHDEKSSRDSALCGPGEGELTESIDWSLERKLVRKIDWALIPLFTIIYCSNFIDRTAIGNAKIAGIERDLGLQDFQYNIALTVFYVVYTIVDIPSNLVLKHFGSIWIAMLVIAFGVVTIGTAFIRNYRDLLITRVFLGIAEGGTLSGLVYIMSRFYRREELVFRIGLFFGSAPVLAGAFGGLLASGLLSIEDFGEVTSWRKIFFIEGMITTILGICCLFLVPNDPLKSKLLSKQERHLAKARIEADQIGRRDARKEKTSMRLVLRSFNFNSCLCTLGYSMGNVSFQGLSLFLPTVVATLGNHSTVQNQLRTVPPYAVACVYTILNAYVSFRLKIRSIPIFLSGLFLVAGYAIFVGVEDPHARYAACFLTVVGGSSGDPMYYAWAADNAAPETVQAVVTALIPGLGTLGAIVAVWTYLPADAPNYHKGNSLNLGTASLFSILALIGLAYARWENRKRAQGLRDYRLVGKTEKEIEELGWMHPKFVYQV